MYQVAICDDEPVMAEANAAMVRRVLDARAMRCGVDYSLDVFSSPEPIMRKLRSQPRAYHLLLLDIGIGNEDGVALAKLLRDQKIGCSIIYVTAYREMAMASFPTHPLEFLTKPVDEKRLADAIDFDLREHFRPEHPVLQTETRPVYLKDILYLEIAGRKVAVHTAEETLLCAEPLSDIEARIARFGFGRSHFSYLVNFACIQAIGKSEVTLTGGCAVPVSRRYYKELAAAHIEWMKQ